MSANRRKRSEKRTTIEDIKFLNPKAACFELLDNSPTSRIQMAIMTNMGDQAELVIEGRETQNHTVPLDVLVRALTGLQKIVYLMAAGGFTALYRFGPSRAPARWPV